MASKRSDNNHVITKFYAKKNMRQALVIAYLGALMAASSFIGFINGYPTELSRQQLADSFGNNIGLKVLLGTPHAIETVGGFVSWRSLGMLILIGSIWGLMLATRLFRGEEQAGRTELMLAGKTTLRKIALQVSSAIGILLIVIFVILTIATIASAAYKQTGISVASNAFFALSLVVCIAIFASLGSVMSQLFATRAQALRASAVVFGMFFLMRGLAASVSSLGWMATFSPLGWIENLQPLTGSHWQWLIPSITLIVVSLVLSWWLAGRRDVGASIIGDSEQAEPKLGLLRNMTTFNIRLMKGPLLGWLAGISFMAVIFGTVAKSAGDAFNSSNFVQNILGRLTQSSNFGVETYYGFIFLIFTLVLLLMVAGMLASMREEEAEGYTDNILVRPIGRLSFISSKTALFVVGILIFSLVTAVAGWFGGISQHADISLYKLLLASINMIAAGFVIVGFGLAIYGLKPRLTAVVLYSFIGWAFIIEMLGSILNLNHYILDTSLLHHLPLAPAVSMKWSVIGVYICIGIVLGTIGFVGFSKRDIQTN